jgi:ribonuclease BN (tRNA processing enzyme)
VSLEIAFRGTRGSIPTPGPGTVRYGGNTACLTVNDERGRRLILDAGTGIRAAGADPSGGDTTILLSHTHWDHIQGLPFYLLSLPAGDSVRIFGPAQPGDSLATILQRQMAPAVFPIPLASVEARIEVAEIRSPELEIGGFLIESLEACHPGATLGYAIRSAAGGARLIYFTDNELRGFTSPGRRAGLVRFLRQADLLVHDGMYFERELEARDGWGHSSAADAVRVALEAGVRRLVLFHHDPGHDDATLERLLDEAVEARDRGRGECDILLAAEGVTLRL